jgi:hypothetical protein
MKVEENTLVIVTAYGDNPLTPQWGIALRKTASDLWEVIIPPKKKTLVFPGQLIPVIHTDGSFRKPESAVQKLIGQILIGVILKLSVKKEAEALLRLIKKDTLVIVLPEGGTPPEICWGVVVKKMPSGNYDVAIGTRLAGLKTERIFAKPGQLLPVVSTDGSTKSPQRALRKNWSEILMHILLRFYTKEGNEALLRLVAAMSRIESIFSP